MKTTTLRKPSKRGFIAWVKSQPALASWSYWDGSKCPFACYLKFLGYSTPSVGGHTWGNVPNQNRPNTIPKSISIALANCAAHITREQLLQELSK